MIPLIEIIILWNTAIKTTTYTPGINFPFFVFNDKVHKLEDGRPPRPAVKRKKDTLLAIGEMTNWIWYELKGSNKEIVNKAGEGNSFVPASSGTYCVAGKYGVGYSCFTPVFVPKIISGSHLTFTGIPLHCRSGQPGL